MARILKQSAQGFSAMDILLDETICSGKVQIDKKLVIEAGGINDYLKAKQKYELIVRIAQKQPVVFEESAELKNGYIELDDDPCDAVYDHGWKTDCYMAGKYSTLLQKNNVFDDVISAILEENDQKNDQDRVIKFLEEMVGKTEVFHRIDEGCCPFLIYKGEDICHNVLNVFAEQLGSALKRRGKQVIYYDCQKNGVAGLVAHINKHFQAVIGIQTFLFSIKMKDHVHYLHEYIYGPKFNFVFDHPVWMRKHMYQKYKDFYILTHDADYVKFIKRYYGQKAYELPPAGIMVKAGEKERIYDLTFVGTYGDYINEAILIRKMSREKRFLANKFLLEMRKNSDETAEKALENVLTRENKILEDGEFLELLYELRRVIYCVMHYYRERVLRNILEKGIQLDVFGDSWKNSSLKKYPNLVCHPDVSVEESLEIWQKSKLALNIMSWHKAGFTERMANIMLSGALLVTDYTTYLDSKYGENDMLIFRLEDMKKLPERIKYFLKNTNERIKVADCGRERAEKEHTWDKRAGQLVDILMKNDKFTDIY